MSPILEEMHNLKEEFRSIFENSENWGEGTLELIDWINKAWNVFSQSCRTLINWFGEVTAYFEHRISNGCVEGVNNRPLAKIKNLPLGEESGFGRELMAEACPHEKLFQQTLLMISRL